jgi:hypothetical protein
MDWLKRLLRRKRVIKEIYGMPITSPIAPPSFPIPPFYPPPAVPDPQRLNEWWQQQHQAISQAFQINANTKYADVYVYTQGGHYYAVDNNGNTICQDSPTSCIQEAMNYLYNTKGGGKIYIKSGHYPVNQTIVLPWDSYYNVIIEGEGMVNAEPSYNVEMGGTWIDINAPAQVLSYNAWLDQQTGTKQYLPYPMLFIRDLGIRVSGDYSNVTTPVIQLYRVWCNLENVYLEASGWFNAQQGFILGMCYGEGPPGVASFWKNVYLSEGVGITGSGELDVLYHRSEGFTWIGGGVTHNTGSQNNQLVPIHLGSVEVTLNVLQSLPLFISSSSAKPSMLYYIRSAGPLELVDVELPDLSYVSSGYHINVGNGSSIVINRWTTIHEAGPPTEPTVYGFLYQPGMLLKQSISVPVGTSGSYGSAVNINVAYANIVGITISVSNVASGETISVKLTMVYADGSTASETLTFSSSTTYTLGLNDYMNLANTSGLPKWYLQAQAASNLSSTSASVTVQAITQ